MAKARSKGLSPMDAALGFLAAKPRTVREVEDKLDTLDFGEGDIIQTVARLHELGLVDDEKYAEDFVATRLATKPVSRRKLKEQLYAHRLPKDVIDAAISTVDDAAEAANARAVAEKYVRQFAALDEEEKKQRVMRRLVGRGFDFAAAKAAVEFFFGDAEGLENVGEDEDDED